MSSSPTPRLSRLRGWAIAVAAAAAVFALAADEAAFVLDARRARRQAAR